ncbi:hypothetical protein QAD02_001020 [Eretmocerus hayati]|uniref:Uncharacterized protein n=1 Tax=Eretmocerus hayati TaxID=131215 RepID=A0ACC2NGI0_9HYME|nr:hypothetical protein QAD02_001020 [Eretmocerus hayati]
MSDICPYCNKVVVHSEKAVRCPECNSGYHESCSSTDRAGRTENGSFKKCCGKPSSRSTSPSAGAISLSPTANTSKNPDLSAIMKQLKTMEKSLKSDVDRVERSLKSELSDIKQSMSNIESKLKEQSDRISTIEEEVNSLHVKNDTVNVDLNQCKSDILVLQEAVGSLQNKVPTLDTEEIYAEVNDRARRQNNIIIYNVKEPQNENCFNCVSEVLSRIKDLNNPVFSCKRIGVATADKPRPILVTFNKFSDALCVLKNRNKVGKAINIASDQTLNQRQHLSNLRAQLVQHNELHPDEPMTIKYDRNSYNSSSQSGGGVLIAISDEIVASEIDSGIKDVEHLFVEFSYCGQKYILSSSYIPPQSELMKYQRHLEAVSSIVNEFSEHKLILLGDFNLPQVSWMVGDDIDVQFCGHLPSTLRSAALAVSSCFSFLDLTEMFPKHPSKG